MPDSTGAIVLSDEERSVLGALGEASQQSPEAGPARRIVLAAAGQPGVSNSTIAGQLEVSRTTVIN